MIRSAIGSKARRPSWVLSGAARPINSAFIAIRSCLIHEIPVSSLTIYMPYAKYNAATRDDAYNLVKNVIIRIAKAARNGDYESIDGISELGHSYKWKIAFLYSDEKLIPIYKKEFLRTIANRMGGNFKMSARTSEMQIFLISKQGDKDIYLYNNQLWNMLSEKERNIRG